MKKLFYILPAVALVMMAGCKDDEPTPEPAPEPVVPENPVPEPEPEPDLEEGPERNPSDEVCVYPEGREEMQSIPLSTQEFNVAKAESKFAFRFIDALYSDIKDNNEVSPLVSPLSASIALSMVANGAVGDTRTEILEALGFGGLDIADVNSFNKKMMSELPIADKNTKLSLANSLWVDTHFPISDSFFSVLEEWYGSEYYTLTPSTFIENINKWCYNKTYGEIENYLPNDAIYSPIRLMNATYFNGQWSEGHKFDKEKTAISQFHNADGSVSDVEFMISEKGRRYRPNTYSQICCNCFGNGAYNFYAILPNEGVDISTALKEYAETDWYTMDKLLAPIGYKIDLRIPKFDIAKNYNLNESLKTLGLKDALTHGDFSAISPYFESIDRINQTSKFRIDEEGVTATSVTDSNLTELGPDDDNFKLVEMNLDRPFIYAIAERSTGVILFVGVIDKL